MDLGWIAIIYGGSYSRFAIKPERHDLARDGGGDRNSVMVDGRRGCACRFLFGEGRRRHVGRLKAGDTSISWIQIRVVALLLAVAVVSAILINSY
jgi:hypothetical protein